MKILYLIIASNNFEHICDEESQRNTWAKSQDNIVWLRGGKEEKYDSIKRTLYVQVEETYENILKKTIQGVRWCAENLEFDYLIRSNVSTYFVEKRVRELLGKENPQGLFLGGFIEFINDKKIPYNKRQFVNGAAIFLNRKAVEILLTLQPEDWNTKPDDYAISQFLISKGVCPCWIPRGNIGATSMLLKRAYYRLKSSENPRMASKRMENLCRVLNSKTVSTSIKSIAIYYLDEIRNAKQNHKSILRYCKSVYSVQASKAKFLALKNFGI